MGFENFTILLAAKVEMWVISNFMILNFEIVKSHNSIDTKHINLPNYNFLFNKVELVYILDIK